MKRDTLGFVAVLTLILFLVLLVGGTILAQPPGDEAPADGGPDFVLTEVWVDDDWSAGNVGPGLTWQVDAFNSISDGIAAVGESTVYVYAGTYTETTTIDKDVHVIGVDGPQITFWQAAGQPDVATSRVVTVSAGVTVTLEGLTIRHGRSEEGQDGGGIHNSGTLTIAKCIVRDNKAADGASPGSNGQNGGGLANSGTLTILSSAILDNESGRAADCTNCDGGWGGDGGGAYHAGSVLFIEGTTIRGNAAGDGGDCHIEGDPDAVTRDGTTGGATPNYAHCDAGEGGRGGGLFVSYSALTIQNSTINANTSGFGGDGIGEDSDDGENGQGGGLSIVHNTSSLSLTNVTISGNTGASSGGGIHIFQGGGGTLTLTLAHCTIVHNTVLTAYYADRGGGGIYAASADVYLKNTVVFGNDYPSGDGSGDDCELHSEGGTFTSQGYNVVGAGTGCPSDGPGDQAPADAKLDALKGNGGPPTADGEATYTHALLPGSPAIDAIPNGQSGCGTTYTTDQRTESRPMPPGSACDSGAYELGYMLEISKSVDDDTPEPGQTLTYTIVVANTGQDVTGGTISDTLPAGLAFVGPISLAPLGVGTAGTAPPLLASDLAITLGARVTVTFPVTVEHDLKPGAELANTAWITATEVFTPVRAGVTVTVAQVAGIAFVADEARTAAPGEAITYTHALTNTGNGPDAFTLTSASSQGWTVAHNGLFVLGSGATVSVLVTVTVPSTATDGTVDTTTITSTSAFNPAAQAAVHDTTTIEIVEEDTFVVHLPIVLKNK